MELVLVAAAALAFAAVAHANAPRPLSPADAYTAWLVRQQKPALHR